MSTEQDRQDSQKALQQATLAFRRGDRTQARRWASLAARLDPSSEKPWLVLAGLASPQASVAYLQKALELNPHSPQARKGLEWAIPRLRKFQAQAPAVHAPIAASLPASSVVPTRPVASATQPIPVRRKRSSPALWASVIFVLVFGGLCVAGLSGAWIVLANAGSAERAISALLNPTLTPTRTPSQPPATPTALPSFTPTATTPPTFTPTLEPTLPEDTATPEPSQIPGESDTNLPLESPAEEDADPTITPYQVDTVTSIPPTDTPEPTPLPPLAPNLPAGVGSGERWIDVDLSEQRVYAYEGDTLVNDFLVSTGTWQYPTVLGQYKVYVKYRYANMSGPGYFLADVPYVMYFYKGYGLHGTYWHSNFGTPMSHGCVNLQTDNAGWLFNWASVGTVVNVHE
jgi:lipoprotein-anchoring transpeptidase ErfK/SrfK